MEGLTGTVTWTTSKKNYKRKKFIIIFFVLFQTVYNKVELEIKEETAKKLFLNTNPFRNLETNYQKAFNFYLI